MFPVLLDPIIYEEWKSPSLIDSSIKDQYLVSNFGRVYSSVIGRCLSPAISQGYSTVQLSLIDGSRKTFYIHRLVGLLFIPNHNRSYFTEINHKDLNRGNNFETNLEWLSKRDNVKHELKNKDTPSIIKKAKSVWSKVSNGESNGMSRFTESQVIIICESIQNGFTINDALYNAGLDINQANRAVVKSIITRKRWLSVSKNYEFPNEIK